jgi:hypothetical protein
MVAAFAIEGSEMLKNLPPSTRQALADRAVYLADAIDSFMKQLKDEIKERNPDFRDRLGSAHDLVSLSAGDLFEAMHNLHERVEDIRELAKKGTRSRRP